MKNLIGKMDYTLLTPTATEEEIIELCRKANELGVKSVCVRPNMVHVAKKALLKSDVLVCTVVSFPEGIDTTEQKLEETKKCIIDGADEVDMVLNYKLFKKAIKIAYGDDEIDYLKTNVLSDYRDYKPLYDEVKNDVETLVNECHKSINKDGDKITLKVIVESSILSSEETEEVTGLCVDSGADFIKTSTGYASNGKGAELNKVQIMKDVITKSHSHMKIKASGGIRTIEDVQKFEPYVDRFGVGFASVDQIFNGEEKISDNY